MTKTARLLLITVLPLMALLAAACGAESDDNTSSTGSETAAANEADSGPASAAVQESAEVATTDTTMDDDSASPADDTVDEPPISAAEARPEDAKLAPELTGIVGWLNAEPFTLESQRGNVVLIDFWTYTCINCIRTLPYLKEWHDKYADEGLVIVGVHAPEFEFEKRFETWRKPSLNVSSSTPSPRTTTSRPGGRTITASGPPNT